MVSILISSFLFSVNAAIAQESQLPPPGPPPAEYPPLENVDSYITMPFTINQTQSMPVEFEAQKGTTLRYMMFKSTISRLQASL